MKNTSLLTPIEKIHFVIKDTMQYETLGEYSSDGEIAVYSGLDEIERYAVAIHELVEKVALNLQGITDEQVTKWDTEDTDGAYDKDMYKKDIRYYAAHERAEVIEEFFMRMMKRNWNNYEKKCENMEIKWKKGENNI